MLTNQDKRIDTFKEVIFGRNDEGKVADIASTYVNGVNQDISLILDNKAIINDLPRLKYD